MERHFIAMFRALCVLGVTVVLGRSAGMGKYKAITLRRQQITDTFRSIKQPDELSAHEVIKVHVSSIGRRTARPTFEAPIWVWVENRHSRHSWTLPWRPGGGPSQDWLEVLLCQNQPSVQLTMQKNSTTMFPLRRRVTTENVKLGDGGTLKSSPADISYRRHLWQPDSDALEIDLNVETLSGADTCASLVVARVCVAHPYDLTDNRVLQRVRFSRKARLTVSRADTADGFWLYLIPEWDNTLCPATASRGQDHHPPPAKTIRVFKTQRAFTRPIVAAPQSDWESFPSGGAVSGGDTAWAAPPSGSSCDERVSLLQEQLREMTAQCNA